MDKGKLIASVGDREITESDMNLLMANLDKRAAAQYQGEQGKQNLVNELINQELIYLDALQAGLDKEEDYLSEIERMKSFYLKQYAVRKVIGSAKVEADEALSFYNENIDKFQGAESIRARHILVDTEESAKEALQEIQAGMPFQDAANEYSKCPSNVQGGDLGYFTKGQMVPEFEEAAFALKEAGELSGLVKTQFGYHIIMLEDRKPAQVEAFENVKDQIVNHLLLSRQNALYFEKINELKDKYPVKISK